MFQHKAYIYINKCIKRDIIFLGDMILDVDPKFINLNRGTNDMERGTLKKWRKYEGSLVVRKLPNDEDKLHKKYQNISILFSLLLRSGKSDTLSHTFRDPHLRITAIKDHIMSQGFLVGARNHGISQDYIQEFINGCSYYVSTKTSNDAQTPT